MLTGKENKHAQPPKTGKVLILALSLEGFTTKLQFLVTAQRELAPIDVTLGYRLKESTNNPSLGQEVRIGREWVFYSLTTLIDTLLARCEMTLKYRKLIIALFTMQMSRAA